MRVEKIAKHSVACLVAMALACTLCVPAVPLQADASQYNVASTKTLTTAKAKSKKVKKSLKKAKLTCTSKVKYTGKAVKPKVVVKLFGKKLTTKCYTVTYLNKSKKKISASKVKKPGTYYVKVTGRGTYKGSKTAKFSVYSKNGKRWAAKTVYLWKVPVLTKKVKTQSVQIMNEKVAFGDKTTCFVLSDDYTKLYIGDLSSKYSNEFTGYLDANALAKTPYLTLPEECREYNRILGEYDRQGALEAGDDPDNWYQYPEVAMWANFLLQSTYFNYDVEKIAWNMCQITVSTGIEHTYTEEQCVAALRPIMPTIKQCVEKSDSQGYWEEESYTSIISGTKVIEYDPKIKGVRYEELGEIYDSKGNPYQFVKKQLVYDWR